jgi:succinyl-diaminopimelate desuccinylase
VTDAALDLTRELIRLDSANPPGNEEACAALCGRRLEEAGFRVERHPLAPGRPSLIARIGGAREGAPLCLTGHLDVVPTGAAPWQHPPFDAELDGARLYGRGASDMKSGVAAMVVAATRRAPRLERSAGLVLVLTAGEETGALGAFDLMQRHVLGTAGAIVVGEPTSNAPAVGHKGCFRFRAVARGVTAHSSMPELGDNAIYKAARAIAALERFTFEEAADRDMGAPTLVVSQMRGGMNINSVPDRAELDVDVRTIPGQDLAALRRRIEATIGDACMIEPLLELQSIFTSPQNAWIQSVFEIAREVAGHDPATRTMPYFTDASALTPAFGNPPTVLLGPGPPEMAHQIDEWCETDRLAEAVEIYQRILDRWV